MALSKGDIAIGGPEGERWTALVLRTGKNVFIRWLSGPLAKREALVVATELKLGSKKR